MVPDGTETEIQILHGMFPDSTAVRVQGLILMTCGGTDARVHVT